jgi:hypothetical protein
MVLPYLSMVEREVKRFGDDLNRAMLFTIEGKGMMTLVRQLIHQGG